MPGYDRTGPNGQGPRTGRGMGYCSSPDNQPDIPARPSDQDGVIYGRGRGGIPYGGGRGFGGGRGRCIMVRPRKVKLVNFEPNVTYFKPRAVPLVDLMEIKLTFDELETLRLVNLQKLSQGDAAKKMSIHQSTFQRTLTRAREKITDALINGKAIRIHGGEYKMPSGDGTGPISPGRGMGRGQGLGLRNGRMNGPFAAGPNGVCKCPKCGHKQKHVRGQPCNQLKCPKCETLMVRG
jgi:predicted DNA-binding protein (UPF0251 family)